jgi:hypothetical protein
LYWLIPLVFTYVKGVFDNGGEWNPTKWSEVPAVGVSVIGSYGNGNLNITAVPTLTPTGTNTALPIGTISPEGGWNIDFGSQNNTNQKTEPWDTNGDSILQKEEADNWWLTGGGVDISVDASKIDWSGLRMPNDREVGNNFNISTTDAFKRLPWETAATYGGTLFQRTGETTADVRDQLYHYKYRDNNSLENIARNAATAIGQPIIFTRVHTPKDFTIKYINRNIYFSKINRYIRKGRKKIFNGFYYEVPSN